jgi:hypothetical protein
MLQPTGPQEDGGANPPPPPPEDRVAAGRDICRPTSALPHFGHLTSASSDLRMMSSSKVFPQRQAYS